MLPYCSKRQPQSKKYTFIFAKILAPQARAKGAKNCAVPKGGTF
jgi:hypothetical protein